MMRSDNVRPSLDRLEILWNIRALEIVHLKNTRIYKNEPIDTYVAEPVLKTLDCNSTKAHAG